MYPIKSLRGISLQHAKLDRQGVQYDRWFTLVRVHDDGHLEPVEVVKYAACALFETEIIDEHVIVRYRIPEEPLFPPTPEQKTALKIPLHPDVSKSETVEVDLYKSKCHGYRMSESYNSWFSSCFGFKTVLVYIGDARRPVLGTMSPYVQSQQNRGWLSTITSYVNYLTGYGAQDPHALTFTSVAAFLIATEASVNELSGRLAEGVEMDVRKFRPNIVVDGEEAYDEEFWGEIVIAKGGPRFVLTGNCGRCLSITVDYDTGRQGTGELGSVWKKMMKDRRVDKGNKWAPIFGRYGFLVDETATIQLGDQVAVTKRLGERCVWDWPRYK